MSAIVRVRDNKGVVHDIPAIVGPKGDTGATGPQGPKGDTYDDSEVRASIDELKEEIAELKYNQDTEYVITTYKEYNQMAIGTNGDTADITEVIGDPSWRHLVVLCDAGSIAYVTGEGGEEPRAWALVAKDGSILSAAGTSAKCENVMLDITTDCYVVVNSIANKEHSLTIISPKKVKSAIENRLATDRFVTADDWVVGAIRTNLGVGSVVEMTVDETIANYRSQVIDCYAGMHINIKGRGGDYGRLWCFVNRENKIIATSEAYAHDAEVIAEQNGKCIVCAEVSSDTVMSVEYTPCSLAPVLDVAFDNSDQIKTIQKTSQEVESRFITNRFITADDWAVGSIKTNGGIGTIVDYTVNETDTNYRWQVIDCYDGMRINIKGRGGDYCRLWCIVDKNNKIISVADAYTTDATLTVETNGRCIIQAEVVKTIPMGVEYTPCSLAPVLDVAFDNSDQIKTIQKTMSDRVPFGIGIDCKYTTPDIDALNVPPTGERLAYFYGLYDSLLADYPDYISKVDCDAVAVAAGIARPDQMADRPIYLYKFVPAYTSKTNAMDGVTAQRSKIKVFITTGTHPEYMAIWDMYHTMRLVCESWKTDENLEALRWDCEIYVMPCSGAYSVESGERVNYNGVDLNRNAPSSNWALTANDGRTYSGPSAGSEYETKVLVHFMGLLAPDVYIDHHNTDPTGDPGIAIYGSAKHQKEVDILSEHISVMTRRWKQRFDTVFPQDDTTIVGYVEYPGYGSVTGSREDYGSENVSRSFTYESQATLLWDNGEIVSGAHKNDVVACTCATDGFINFLLRMLKTTN